MIIRKAKLDDSEEIAKVQVAVWKTSYRGIVPDNYLDSMAWEDRFPIWEHIVASQIVYVTENQNKNVVGFCHIGKGSTEEYTTFDNELYSFYIRKEYQRKRAWKTIVL